MQCCSTYSGKERGAWLHTTPIASGASFSFANSVKHGRRPPEVSAGEAGIC